MRKILLVSILSIICSSFISLNAQWVKIYGESEGETAYFLQQSIDGGYIVVGYFGSSRRVLVLKLNIDGDIEWQKRLQPSYMYNPLSFQQTNDGGYVFVSDGGEFVIEGINYFFKKEIAIIKLSQSGAVQGSFGRAVDLGVYPKCYQVTSDDGFILSGGISGSGGGDIWVSKLDSSAEIEWQKLYGGFEYNLSHSIQQTSDGGYILACSLQSFGVENPDVWILKLDLSGDIEWQKTYGGNDYDSPSLIQETSGGGYILACNSNSFGAGDRDIWILKLTSSGDIEWQKAYGGSENDDVYSIQQTSDSGYIVGGKTVSFGEGEDDAWILKLLQNGDIEWQKTFGTSSVEMVKSVLQATDGMYIAAGSIFSFGAGGSDFLVLKLQSDGSTGLLCRFLQDSFAAAIDTNISSGNTNIIPYDASIIHESVTPPFNNYETFASEFNLCSQEPLLSVSTTSGGTTDPDPGTYVHDLGDEVTVRATPATGYAFSGWSGDAAGTTNPITITLDSDKSVTANFDRQFYILSISAGEGGTTDPRLGNHNADPGIEVIIEAIPDSGYEFNEWSGDATGADNPITITIDSDISVGANFLAVSEQPEEKAQDDIFHMTCFIASATYGSPFHPHIEVLRDFRDEYLMDNKIGRELVDLYYKYSPSVARMIEQNGILKIAVRIHLVLFVAFSYSMIKFGPIFTAIIFLSMFLIPLIFIVHRKREGA